MSTPWGRAGTEYENISLTSKNDFISMRMLCTNREVTTETQSVHHLNTNWLWSSNYFHRRLFFLSLTKMLFALSDCVFVCVLVDGENAISEWITEQCAESNYYFTTQWPTGTITILSTRCSLFLIGNICYSSSNSSNVKRKSTTNKVNTYLCVHRRTIRNIYSTGNMGSTHEKPFTAMKIFGEIIFFSLKKTRRFFPPQWFAPIRLLIAISTNSTQKLNFRKKNLTMNRFTFSFYFLVSF